MTISERIHISEQKFESKKTEREQHLVGAEECLIEMNKLQGEWRLLQELESDNIEQLGEATTIEAIPEVEDK